MRDHDSMSHSELITDTATAVIDIFACDTDGCEGGVSYVLRLDDYRDPETGSGIDVPLDGLDFSKPYEVMHRIQYERVEIRGVHPTTGEAVLAYFCIDESTVDERHDEVDDTFDPGDWPEQDSPDVY